MADIMYGSSVVTSTGPTATVGGGDTTEETNTEFFGGVNNNAGRPRFPGLYIGNLTWWTTDQDVINAINSVGVNDVQEVKFFENRNNGQSKGFCVVTFTSDTSLPTVMDKLPKLELYGQNPVVTPYNRQNLNLFESQTKQLRPQINSGSNNGPAGSHAAGIMGISSISGVHANTQGLPYSAGGMNFSGVYNNPQGMPYSAGGMNSYNPALASSNLVGGGMGIPRQQGYHGGMGNMRMQMRTPRPMMRANMPNSIGNGPGLQGSNSGPPHQMNPRMRFMHPPSGIRRMDDRGMRPDDRMPSRHDDRPSHWQDDRSLRLDDRGSSSRRTDDRGPPIREDDGRLSSRRDDDNRMARRDEERSSSRRDDDSRMSRREDERYSRREDESRPSTRREDDVRSSSRREERSSRHEKESSSSRRDKSYRERSRSREKASRDRSRDRSKERKREKRHHY